MKTSSILLSACLCFIPINYSIKGLEIRPQTKEEVKIGMITLETAIKDDEQIQNYLRTLRMLDRFPTYELRQKVKKISDKLEIDQRHLYKVFYHESKGNPQAINKFSRATGLIQFLPRTAERLGTTVNKLYNMSSYDQLDYVLLYFTRNGRIRNSLSDVALSVFYPKAVYKSNDYIIADMSTELGKKILKGNASLDLNNDGVITKQEFITRSKSS